MTHFIPIEKAGVDSRTGLIGYADMLNEDAIREYNCTDCFDEGYVEVAEFDDVITRKCHCQSKKIVGEWDGELIWQ